MLTKSQTELRIFEVLAPLSGLEVVPGSVRQGKPPVPDIECQVVGLGALAVELAALDDESTFTRLSNMFATEEGWKRALRLRPTPEQERLSAECADVFLSLQINNKAGSRDRTRIMSAIQAAILTKTPGFSGALFSDLELPDGLADVTVHRGHVKNGPRMVAPSVGNWMPANLDKIVEKLTEKNYTTSAPLELFVYSTHDELMGHVNSFAQIDACVKAHLSGSRFQRVRAFDLFMRRLEYTYPPVGAPTQPA